jgi:aminopeptidase N
MPDLPAASGVYQGKLSATFVIQESGRTSNVSVNASDLRLGGAKVNQQAVERYAANSLRIRTFSPRPEPCKVTFSAWVN